MTQQNLDLPAGREPRPTTPNVHFVHRVLLRNYRSIEACDVHLGPITFLVGPNGAGKSNFLDALRLITDSLRTTLDHALRDRGGRKEVCRRSGGHPVNFAIRVEFALANGVPGWFAVDVGAEKEGGFSVRKEECSIGSKHRYLVKKGQVVVPPDVVAPVAASDRLYLVSVSSLPAFRPVFEALSRMGFYNLNPDRMREFQTPDRGEVLARDGSNLASVLGRLKTSAPATKGRIEEYVARVVPGIEGVDVKQVEHMETLEFRQRVEGQRDPWRFGPKNMSDGTLRVLGALVALFQQPTPGAVPLVGLEEPEVALHPAAAGILRDCLAEATRHRQVIVTSHSPDLLDDPSIDAEAIVAVVAQEGTTKIAGIDAAGRDVLRQHLYTAGELLRADQLHPDPDALPSARQLQLFSVDDDGETA